HAVVLRQTNGYGPGMREGNFPMNMIGLLMRGKKVGGSDHTRDFIYIEDAIHAIVAAGRKLENNELDENMRLLVSSDEGPKTMREVVEEVVKHFPDVPRDFWFDETAGDVRHLDDIPVLQIPSLNNARAKELLFEGRPLVSFQEGIRRLVEFAKGEFARRRSEVRTAVTSRGKIGIKAEVKFQDERVVVRAPLIEPKRMSEGIAAKQEMQLNRLKYRMFLRSIRRAEALGIDLERELVAFAQNEEVLKRLGIGTPAAALDQGYYLVQYKSQYGMSYIRQLLAKRAEDVRLVIFASPEDVRDIKAKYARELKDLGESFLVLPETELQSYAADLVQRREVAGVQMIQIRTDRRAETLNRDLVKAALLGAVDLAIGRIVIASDQPVTGAQELTFYDVVIATFEAARQTAISA
ncbi:MAG: NAD(P)-dependent oxidoreductase, partial [Candidatus Omnitrophica bacterium]|nr:NAD(P)-dependent oxidoreductase [Candidatus Omnitrophota bacterium]